MTMIERVARAIYEGRNGRGCKPWGNLPNSHRAPYLADAKAAIEAMREPTDLMGLPNGYRPGLLSASQIYTAMIDAALREMKLEIIETCPNRGE